MYIGGERERERDIYIYTQLLYIYKYRMSSLSATISIYLCLRSYHLICYRGLFICNYIQNSDRKRGGQLDQETPKQQHSGSHLQSLGWRKASDSPASVESSRAAKFKGSQTHS